MGNTSPVPLDRNELPVKLKRTVTFVDEIVCSDGPVFHAISRIFGKFDCKDLADLVMKAPIPVIVNRFAELPKNAHTQDFEKAFQDCFYPGFPDIMEWTPPDLPGKTPRWLTDNEPHGPDPVLRTGSHEDKRYLLELFGTPIFPVNQATNFDLTELPQPILDSETASSCSIPELTRYLENNFARSIILLWGKLGSPYRRSSSCSLTLADGTRSYYLTRSQPPVFSMMLSAYHAFTGDLELIRNTYMDAQREYLYWLEGDARQVCVAVEGKHFRLSRYLGHAAQPRTESWESDVAVVRDAERMAKTGSYVFNDEVRAGILRSIRAAAESGWDFSSRWVPFDMDAVEQGVMPNMRTESLLPVDLNRHVTKAL
ncbi:hypothetical protein, conserved [Eimeria praecox]|uniref:Trehalase n=1 Tax=Eimeria praecox TaxID=51316 RepID=U6H0Z3_9EIME|nr:hypothetical protein, conserved [Eimeria praecox]